MIKWMIAVVATVIVTSLVQGIAIVSVIRMAIQG